MIRLIIVQIGDNAEFWPRNNDSNMTGVISMGMRIKSFAFSDIRVAHRPYIKINFTLLTCVGPKEESRSGFSNIYYSSQGPGTATSQDLTFDVTSSVKFLLSSRWLVDHYSLSPIFHTHVSRALLHWNHLFIHTSL